MSIVFSPEQQRALDVYSRRDNLFITGPGGTGKSQFIKHIQKQAVLNNVGIQVCALTGCAAVLLECKARTVHSWAGIGIASGTIEANVTKVMKNRMARETWRTAQVLVVDEISMMSKKMFEMLDAIGKACRRNSLPFGGIQLIFSGDFFQLPPVGDSGEPDTVRFCFESPLWSATFKPENHVQLTTMFRQTDVVYQKVLSQIRCGRVTKSSNAILMAQVGKDYPSGLDFRPTKLFPTRNKVDSVNMCEITKLGGDELVYETVHRVDLEMTPSELRLRGQFTKTQIINELSYLQGNLRCGATVRLKVGAQVMCIVNMELSNGETLCNGSQGVVVGISSKGFPRVRYNSGPCVTMNPHAWNSENIPGIGVEQVPLILAWALTIHKAQGATLDVAEIDAGAAIFECGQTYVALSRVKSLDGLYLTSFDVTRVKINRVVQEFYKNIDGYQLIAPRARPPPLPQPQQVPHVAPIPLEHIGTIGTIPMADASVAPAPIDDNAPAMAVAVAVPLDA